MTGSEWSVLGGVFLGGAFPWLEAIVVIPIGILAGLPPVLVALVAVTGNLLTVGLAAVFGQRLRIWWTARRHARSETAAPSEDPAKLERRNQRRVRIDRVMDRWGMLGLAVLGPIGLGTQLSALAAVALGVSAREAIVWVGAGTVAWSVVAAVLTVTGVSIAGIGI